jgi:hypothetical protein
MGWEEDVRYRHNKMYSRVITCTPEGKIYRNKKEIKMKNDVASFFYYMWNTWNRSECEAVFPGRDADHFWEKWVSYCQNGTYRATEQFFANLDENYQDMLVKRATEMYDRRNKIN